MTSTNHFAWHISRRWSGTRWWKWLERCKWTGELALFGQAEDLLSSTLSLLLLFWMEGLQIVQQVIIFKMWTVFICQLMDFSLWITGRDEVSGAEALKPHLLMLRLKLHIIWSKFPECINTLCKGGMPNLESTFFLTSLPTAQLQLICWDSVTRSLMKCCLSVAKLNLTKQQVWKECCET